MIKINRDKKEKRGFTLVELIIILVILAILAAILVPALLGYITKAKEKSSLLNARTFYTAVQTVAIEDYGAGHAYFAGTSGPAITYEAITNTRARPSDDPDKRRIRQIYDLMEVTNIHHKFEAIAIVEKGIVTVIRYKNLDLNVVFEWKREASTWKKLEGITDSTPWAGDILPPSYTNRDIFWNGYSPL